MVVVQVGTVTAATAMVTPEQVIRGATVAPMVMPGAVALAVVATVAVEMVGEMAVVTVVRRAVT
jgi:hypothetical protein